MKKIRLALQNATYAIKAKSILARGGVKAKIIRLTLSSAGGCTHGIIIDETDLLKMAELLRSAGIAYRLIGENDLF